MRLSYKLRVNAALYPKGSDLHIMIVLVVFCHPEPTSFNGALKDTAVQVFENSGATVEVSDLYAENFDPVEKQEHYHARIETDTFEPLSEQRHSYKTETLPADVEREIQRLRKSDLVIFQFPLWWHQQPAMIKGWCDRVFVAGGLYTSKMRYDKGYFQGKRAICSVTSGAPEDTFTEFGRGGGEIAKLLHPLNYSLHYMGFSVLPPRLITEVQGAGFTYKDPEEFAASLQLKLSSWASYLENIDSVEPMSFPGWGDWDEHGVEKKV